MLRTAAGESLLDSVQFFGCRNLWQQDRIRLGGGRGEQIVPAPRRGQRVDAHDDLAFAEACTHRRANLVAGRLFGVGGDGVLQVEDQRIRLERARLFQGARVGSRQVKNAPARTDVAHDGRLNGADSRRRGFSHIPDRDRECRGR
jgi:hypothetical protein